MNKRILLHIGFWLIYLLYNGYLSVPLSGTTFADLSMLERLKLGYLSEFLLLLIKIPAVYFVLYRLLPRSFQVKNILPFALQFLLVAFVMTVLIRLSWYNIIFEKIYHIDPPKEAATFWIALFRWVFSSIDALLLLGIASAIKLFRIRLQTAKKEKELIEEKLQSELKFLRSQTNPHFLFNTLNNLYHLARKNSKATPDAILKLSGLMRFMLYECAAPQILVSQEIKLISDYIDLEKLRYGKRLNINFNVDTGTGGQSIAPLLLLPFVENAFKHGASENRGETTIHILLKIKNNMLNFSVRNTKGGELTVIKEGIGIKNIKRQLDLIYPQHELKISDHENIFQIDLNIDLNEKKDHD
ncbi:MAG TPA: hypothetical protein ENJ95_23945 [Bacteroidetes bacterium]|nr:hypothetical protein [Bacteroidota bacterium]